MNYLNIIKASENNHIPSKVIKMHKGVSAGFTAKYFNNCINKGLYPDDLRQTWSQNG